MTKNTIFTFIHTNKMSRIRVLSVVGVQRGVCDLRHVERAEHEIIPILHEVCHGCLREEALRGVEACLHRLFREQEMVMHMCSFVKMHERPRMLNRLAKLCLHVLLNLIIRKKKKKKKEKNH